MIAFLLTSPKMMTLNRGPHAGFRAHAPLLAPFCGRISWKLPLPYSRFLLRLLCAVHYSNCDYVALFCICVLSLGCSGWVVSTSALSASGSLERLVSKMINKNNVVMGTLSPIYSLTHSLTHSLSVWVFDSSNTTSIVG